MPRVLVLGSAGYIGSELCLTLMKLGYNVIAVDNLRYNQGVSQINLMPYQLYDVSNSGTYNFLRADCNKWKEIKELVKVSDIIFPLFALVGAPLCEAHPKLAQKTNFDSIKKIIDNLGEDQRIIFNNTNSSYGSYNGICTEKTPTKCLSLYSKTKNDAEKYILDHHKNSIVFRLATVFGMSPRVRMDLIVNDWIYKAYYDKKIKIFNPEYRRNYVHVADVCQALIWAINNGDKTEIYNLGNDKENKTKLQLAEQIQTAIPFEIELGEGEDVDQRNYEVSSEKLKKAGFQANISINQAITEFKEYFSYLPKRKKIREKMLKYNKNY